MLVKADHRRRNQSRPSSRYRGSEHSIERDGRHSLTPRSIQVVAELTPVSLAAEHLIPAHPGPHHHILPGTVGESHTPMDKNTASLPGDGVDRGGDKRMKKMRYAGTLTHIQVGI